MIDLERLYRLPLADFIRERNALAKELRARVEGDDEAERVRRLAKPSVAAWIVNQLYYEERGRFDSLLEAAAKQRAAVARGASMSTEASESRRKAFRELLASAERRARAAGSSWTPALRQRVTRTLDALAARPDSEEARPGRLTGDLEPPGFDALLGTPIKVVKRSESGSPKANARKPTAAARRRLEEARKRVDAARREVSAAKRKRTAGIKAVERTEARAAQAEKRARTAERKAETARTEAHERDLERRNTRSALDEAERLLTRAESSLESAKRKLSDLG